MLTDGVTARQADGQAGAHVEVVDVAQLQNAKADSGTHGGGGAGKILKKIRAWLSIRRQGVRRR
jgi:hypothetical protein